MEIDWFRTIEDILDSQASCPRCGVLAPQLLAGYSREHWAAYVAPRCHDCKDKVDCDSRKLVFLCEKCAMELRLRARPVDQAGMMVLLLQDCREDLQESLEYLAEFWQEDLDIAPEDVNSRLDEFAPEVFDEESSHRSELEEEYLTYHRWFREKGIRVPESEWRFRYVEDIIAIGYKTQLGD